ncbi:MAG: site-specific DNA-methyltransferase [Spirulinaceae cyanobacterium SM2_1_0]|nr:site-specific DNA-methyltransferase [Spirulinaceae cyanobacterium SM2_1_0]
MTHLSENSKRLEIVQFKLSKENDLCKQNISKIHDVCIVVLPIILKDTTDAIFEYINCIIDEITSRLEESATLVVIGETSNLVHVHELLANSMQYHLWIAIKRKIPKAKLNHVALPEAHFGALVYTNYRGSLRHTKTRLAYTYCPACGKTTKDYGGKKHTYNSYGTLISDVWRDMPTELEGNLDDLIRRFADLFGIDEYSQMVICDYRQIYNLPSVAESSSDYTIQNALFTTADRENDVSRLILGDSLEELRKIPDNSIDFAFADPPYNLSKKYNGYADDLSITEYFDWCDRWISELARVLRPGKTCAVLNIPLWCIRHFVHMTKVLRFQNWIAWDALSFPVRLIMPAHYGILCFSKGMPRPLPGLIGEQQSTKHFDPHPVSRYTQPLAEGYCLRSRCVRSRKLAGIDDRAMLTDLWWDIHRLKHNSRRVDHPCQLPPQLMYRLISIFTEPEEVVLDCFNGTGTTTLAAHQLQRQYIGIEVSEKYHAIAEVRHKEVSAGIDPFRKAKRQLTEKNSPVERMKTQTYKIPKKTLQLEVRRVAKLLGKLPNRQEMMQHGQYSIEYYDRYFASWGEVCAAARHDGMTEERVDPVSPDSTPQQLSLFE